MKGENISDEKAGKKQRDDENESCGSCGKTQLSPILLDSNVVAVH